MSKFAFVAGATGAAATRLVEELLRQKWRVIGVSRKAPDTKADGELTYLPANLLDAGGLRLAISPYRDITHLFFTARASHEETGVEPVAENVAMLHNALDAAEAASSLLEHVHLVQGTKWYGMHLGNFKTPARENDPRHLRLICRASSRIGASRLPDKGESKNTRAAVSTRPKTLGRYHRPLRRVHRARGRRQ
jgi:nucleoside-diphosphate-sugar epimerase